MFSGHLVEHIPQLCRVKQSVAICLIAIRENTKKMLSQKKIELL